MNDPPKKDDVLQANIDFHTVLADTYNTEQPHFREENKVLVSNQLARLAGLAGSELLIDLGCGTGFIIELAEPYYHSIIGIDITPAMISQVDLSSRKVNILQANTESIPLNDNIANVITANSFLHHLYNIRPTAAEAYRLLKAGGVFYSEEDPNSYFWDSIKGLEVVDKEKKNYSEMVDRERTAVLESHGKIEAAKRISARVVQMAEYQKMIRGGMCAEEMEKMFYQTGFSKVGIEYYWFLGQGKVMSQSPNMSQKIESYLRSILPISRQLFKYFKIEAWK